MHLNVLFILGSYNLGGSERQALLLAEWMRREAGINVGFAAFGKEGPVSKRLTKLEIPWKIIPYDLFFIDSFKKASLSKKSIGYGIKSSRISKKFAEELQFFEPDVLLPFTFYPNVAAALAYPDTTAKTCIWNQRDIKVDGMRGFHLEKKAVSQSSHFVSNSAQGAETLKNFYNIPESKITIIPNGVKEIKTPSTATAVDFGLDPAAFKAVMLGNFHQNKDQLTLVKALKILIDAYPGKKMQLVLAGRFGGTEKMLKEVCRAEKIEQNVVFLDSVDDTEGLISVCDIGVFSSPEEGSPNAVIETMISGKAIVASDIVACVDILGSDYPLLAVAGDSQSFAQKIEHVMNDTTLRESLAISNKKRAKEKFSIAVAAKAYIKLIRDII